jgi:hypothetical protein
MKFSKDFLTRYATVLAFCLMGTAAAMGSGSGGGGAVVAVVGAEAVEAEVPCFRRQVALLSKLTTKCRSDAREEVWPGTGQV